MTTRPTHPTSVPSLPHTVEVVVIGGGPAGLQAALTLGRMHREVLLVDSGEYRNAAAGHLHNFITQDGTPPEEFRARARADLSAYATVTRHDGRVTGVTGRAGSFSVRVDGEYAVRAAAVLLATGVRDTLPPTPGLEALWGGPVAHCPFCHGHEFAGQPVGILGVGPSTVHLAGMLGPIAARLTVFADGAEPEPDVAAGLAAHGVSVRPGRVAGVCPSSLGATVSLEDGTQEDLGGLFVTTTLSQSAPFAEELGLALLPSGCIEVDEFGATSVPGVYAAGDLAHRATLPMPMASVLVAAGAGQVTASWLNGQLASGDLALAPEQSVGRAG